MIHSRLPLWPVACAAQAQYKVTRHRETSLCSQIDLTVITLWASWITSIPSNLTLTNSFFLRGSCKTAISPSWPAGIGCKQHLLKSHRGSTGRVVWAWVQGVRLAWMLLQQQFYESYFHFKRRTNYQRPFMVLLHYSQQLRLVSPIKCHHLHQLPAWLASGFNHICRFENHPSVLMPEQASRKKLFSVGSLLDECIA